MRRTFLLPLLLLPLSSCADRPAPPEALTGSPPAERTAAEVPTTPNADGSSLWDRLSPQEKAAARRTIDRVYAEAGDVPLHARLALVAGQLPDGATAILIRDPSSPSRPIIVLSEQAAGDALALGVAALTEDIQYLPSPRSHRVLRITPDRRVLADEAGRTRDTGIRLPETGAASDRTLTGQLLGRATSVATVELPGIGRARLLSFD